MSDPIPATPSEQTAMDTNTAQPMEDAASQTSLTDVMRTTCDLLRTQGMAINNLIGFYDRREDKMLATLELITDRLTANELKRKASFAEAAGHAAKSPRKDNLLQDIPETEKAQQPLTMAELTRTLANFQQQEIRKYGRMSLEEDFEDHELYGETGKSNMLPLPPLRSTCLLCDSSSHRASHCQVYSTAADRVAILRRKSLCIKCLKRHPGGDCSTPHACDGCAKFTHHRLVCKKLLGK